MQGERIAEALVPATAERNVLPAVAVPALLGSEAIGVEGERVFPQGGVALHRQPPEDQHGARWYAVTADDDVAGGHPGTSRSGRAQP